GRIGRKLLADRPEHHVVFAIKHFECEAEGPDIRYLVGHDIGKGRKSPVVTKRSPIGKQTHDEPTLEPLRELVADLCSVCSGRYVFHRTILSKFRATRIWTPSDSIFYVNFRFNWQRTPASVRTRPARSHINRATS